MYKYLDTTMYIILILFNAYVKTLDFFRNNILPCLFYLQIIKLQDDLHNYIFKIFLLLSFIYLSADKTTI